MAGHREAPVARHRGVQRTARRGAARERPGDVGEPAARRRPAAPCLVAISGDRDADRGQLSAGPGDPLADGAEQPVWRRSARAPGIQMSSPNSGGLLRAVGDDVPDLQRRHAVDQRLVRLGVDRDAVLGQALDEVHLPQRPGLVQRPRAQPRDQVVQLGVAARGRQRRAPDVVGDVEVAVVDPHRPRQARAPPRGPSAGTAGSAAAAARRSPAGSRSSARCAACAGSTATRRTSGSTCSPGDRTTRRTPTTWSP